jgi:hypothetical protein
LNLYLSFVNIFTGLTPFASKSFIKNQQEKRRRNSPVHVPALVMRLAELKAKPDANHANTHAHVSLLVSDLQPALRPTTLRRTGFKSNTSRTNRARKRVSGPLAETEETTIHFGQHSPCTVAAWPDSGTNVSNNVKNSADIVRCAQ